MEENLGGCKVKWQRERKREKWKQICKCLLLIKIVVTVIIMTMIIVITGSVHNYIVLVLAMNRRIFKQNNPKTYLIIYSLFNGTVKTWSI